MSCNCFETESGVLRAIEEFERGTISSERWDHDFRLVVTMWYLLTHEEAVATSRLISRMRAMERMHDQPADKLCSYHETTTVFWIAIARLFLSSSDLETGRLNVLNRFLGCFSDRQSMILEHYRPRTLQSWEARVGWVEPDLEPLAVLLPASNNRGRARGISDGVDGCRPNQS
jgi:hypothetical protein